MVEHEELGDEIASIAAKLNVVNHQLISRIRRFDEIEGWFVQGAMSCAHWLTWRIGLDPGAAREKVRVARALGGLPRVDAAFAAGRLSYAKVRAITRVATPENEERLLDVSLAATGAQLEQICRGLRLACAGDRMQAEERYVRARTLGSGLVRLEAIVTPDESDLILKALTQVRKALTPPNPPPLRLAPNPACAHPPRAPSPSAVDALVHIASTTLGGGQIASGATSGDQFQVVIHVDRQPTEPDGTLSAWLEDGTPVSAETLRRVCCDGGIVAAAVDDQGAVLSVGRRTRAIPTAIRRALWIRDQGCRFPGCMNQRHLHGHHVKHWLHGGPTSLDNLVLLCGFHHRLLHEAGFAVKLQPDGDVEVRNPAGAILPAHPTLAAARDIVDWGAGTAAWPAAPDEPRIDAMTTMPSWDGERMDLDRVVSAIA